MLIDWSNSFFSYFNLAGCLGILVIMKNELDNEELDLSRTMFSLFTPDEIRTLIEHRRFREMKTLQMPQDKQLEFREVIRRIEDMFDV